MTAATGPDFQANFAAYQQGAFSVAVAGSRRLVALRPSDGSATHLLSLSEYQLSRHANAEHRLRRAAMLLSGADRVDALINRASALLALGRHADALGLIARALAVDPGNARAFGTRAAILRDRLKPAEALHAGRQAIVLEPEGCETWIAIGNVLQLAGRLREAIAAFSRALAITPTNVVAHGNLQFTLCFVEGTDDEALFKAARQWGKVIEASLPAAPRQRPSAPRQRLRIGYHSFEFFSHSALDDYFPPILRSHDRRRFEIVLISDGGRCDHRTDELHQLADHWIDLAGLDLPSKIARLRAADLDIAVCLTGYLAVHRLVFAPRIAPIQVAHMNHVATTGMTAFDYRITDSWLDPVGLTDRWNTERLVRLSHGYVAMLPPSDAPRVTPLPARANGYVTFGSFNNLSKVTSGSLALWSRAMAALPASRLLFKARAYDDPATRARYCELATAAGIDPGQIDFLGTVDGHRAHLAALGRADMALDAVPFSGGRSTVDTLSMGVPVINLRSPSLVGRLGGSMLSRAGLGDLVAGTAADFIDIAVDLGRNLDRLERLRTELRDRLETSTLCDAVGYTRELEAAFVAMAEGKI